MLNELLALYPKAQLGITTRNNTPYIWYRDADTCWSVTEGGYVSGFDLRNEYHFVIKQFDDINDIVNYIAEIVDGIVDQEK